MSISQKTQDTTRPAILASEQLTDSTVSLDLADLDAQIKAASARKDAGEEERLQSALDGLIQAENIETKSAAVAAAESQTLNKFLKDLDARDAKLLEVREHMRDFDEWSARLAGARTAAQKRLEALTIIYAKAKTALVTIEGDKRRTADKLQALRAAKPKPVQSKTQADLEEEEARATTARLLEAAVVTRIASHTRGLKVAILGGVPGRESAKNLSKVLLDALELKDMEWYASKDNGGQGNLDRLMQSLKFGGVGMLIVYANMSGHHYGLLDLCKKRNIPVITLHTASPKVALVEIAKYYNVAAGPFLDA
jgi:hypothetical protein